MIAGADSRPIVRVQPLASSHAAAQHVVADLVDESTGLRERDERHRAEQAAFGMLPAHQRFECSDPTGAQLVDRLVVHHELAALGRAAQVHFEIEALDRGKVHLAREHAYAVLPVSLGGVHREIGVAQHLVGVCTDGSERDSDARGRGHVLRAEHDGFLQRDEDAFRDLVRHVAVIEVVDEHRELVAAESGCGVALAQAPGEPVADDAEQVVTGRVAEAVVHGLEVVEVDEQHCQLPALPLQSRRRVIDPVPEERLVREPRERIVKRLVDELALQPPVLGDVSEAPHPAADLAADPLRQRIAFEHPPVLELEQVVALRLGVGVELLDLGDERSRIAELIEHRCQRVVVVARFEGLRWNAPHLDEAAVEARDAAHAIDDEDAVGRRFEGGGQHRVGGAEIVFRDDAVGDVVSRGDEPFDGGVVEQVREGEGERNRVARGMAKTQVDGDGCRRGVRTFVVHRAQCDLERPRGRARRRGRATAALRATPGRARGGASTRPTTR